MKRIKAIGIGILLIVCTLLSMETTGWAADEKPVLTVEQEGQDYVHLQWTEVPDADGYCIDRSEETGNFSTVKSVTGRETRNYGLHNGTTYTYRIRAYRMDALGSRNYLAESDAVTIHIGVSAPTRLNKTICSSGSVKLTWQGHPDDEGYLLYKSEDGENWSIVKSCVNPETITYGLTQGVDYRFRVKACRTVAGKKRYSENSEEIGCRLGLDAPDRLSVIPISSDAVCLRWEPVEFASEYRIYRAEDGEFRLIKTVSEPVAYNYGLQADQTYTYRVAAVGQIDGVSFKSGYSQEIPICAGLDAPTNIRVCYRSKSSAELSWDEVPEATGYRVYRKEEGQSFRLIKTVKETQTVNYGLTEGACYEYQIKAIREEDQITQSGTLSDAQAYYHAMPEAPICTQQAVNELTLSWKAVPGATLYHVYRIENEEYTEVAACSTASTAVSVNTSNASFCISAERDGVESDNSSVIEAEPVLETTRSFRSHDIQKGQIRLEWESVPFAGGYELARRTGSDGAFVTLNTCKTADYADTDVKGDTEYSYRYRIQYETPLGSFYGNWSEELAVTYTATPNYRALLIGEENYTNVLHGPENDVNAMEKLLGGMEGMAWDVYAQTDATEAEIISLVELAFSGATEDDVSLFYYSGHGITGAGDHYSGALVTVEEEYFTLTDLADLLSGIPGKVVVILDSCGSGAAISEQAMSDAADAETFTPERFNQSVVEAFSDNSPSMERSGAFRENHFYVLTASAYEQNSKTLLKDGVWGGALTRGITESAGYDFNTGVWSNTMPGDTDEDGALTLEECYRYCQAFAEAYQDVCVYPDNSTLTLFRRDKAT